MALAPALAGSSALHRGWQQQPHNYNEAGLMRWQDRLPALLSLSFVPGLLGVPALIIVSMYLRCTAQPPKHTATLLFTGSLYGGQPALKLRLQHFLFYSLQRKGLQRLLLPHTALQRRTWGLLGTTKPFYSSPLALKQRQVFDTGSHQWDKQFCPNEGNLACTASSNMAAGFSLAVWLGGERM